MKKITLILIGLFVSLFFFAETVYAQTNCPNVTKSDISALFEQWDTSLQTGKSSEVIKTYADNAVLLPTLSNIVRNDPAEIKDYFEQFLTLKPDGTINEANIRIYCDMAINSGIYTFAIVKNGKPEEVKARYTFVYRKIGDRWLIVEHHSSGMPEKIS